MKFKRLHVEVLGQKESWVLLRAEQFLVIERGHVLYNLEVMQAYGQYTKLEGSTIDSSGGNAVFSRSRSPAAQARTAG